MLSCTNVKFDEPTRTGERGKIGKRGRPNQPVGSLLVVAVTTKKKKKKKERANV